MFRSVIALLMLTAAAVAMVEPANAQPVQYQFTPPPPIRALPSSQPPSYPSIPGVAAPAPAPGGSGVVPYNVRPAPRSSGYGSTRSVYTDHGRRVLVPTRPTETFGDRVSNCAHAGAAAGLGPNQLGTFMGRCTN
jgi:hypothetical protein